MSETGLVSLRYASAAKAINKHGSVGVVISNTEFKVS